MSLDNISTLAGKFQNQNDLQAYCDAQYITLKKTESYVKELQAEISHLKELVSATQPLLNSPQSDIIIKSSEQSICEMEIERIRKISMDRNLTLEETKRFDLIVKNLLLSKGLYKDIVPDYKKLPPGFSEAKLVEIAAMMEPVFEEN